MATATIDTIQFDSAPARSRGFTAVMQSSTPTTLVAAGITIPANTAVVVRLIDAVDSAQDEVGKEYRASLDEPVVSSTGQVLAPRGVDAVLVLTQREQSGHLAGKTELTLALRSLALQGRRYPVASTDVVQGSASRTVRSAKTIGGLAAAGAVVGALAGGGRGAAIGAGSGAALGTLGQVLTKGQRVRVPSETRLTFRLQQALLVQR